MCGSAGGRRFGGMGVQFDTEEARRMAKELADRLGVSETFIVEESLRTQMEAVGLLPRRDPGVRSAAIIVEQIRERVARLPPDEREAHQRRTVERMEILREIQDSVARLPVLDPRPIEEIVRDIYDEDGIPK